MGNYLRTYTILKPGPGASLTGQYVCDGWGAGSQFLATKFGTYLNFKRFQVDVQPYDGGGWGVVFNYALCDSYGLGLINLQTIQATLPRADHNPTQLELGVLEVRYYTLQRTGQTCEAYPAGATAVEAK